MLLQIDESPKGSMALGLAASLPVPLSVGRAPPDIREMVLAVHSPSVAPPLRVAVTARVPKLLAPACRRASRAQKSGYLPVRRRLSSFG